MKIIYLLDSTMLCGGVKVVFCQARALAALGHETVVICQDGFPDWFDGRVGFIQGNIFDMEILGRFDRVVATSPLHLLALYDQPGIREKIWHLVQGYEGGLDEVAHLKEQIVAGYQLPVPKITVSEQLCNRLKTLFPGILCRSAGQGIETDIFYPGKAFPVETVIISGPLAMSVKNIRAGLKAFSLLKQRYPSLELIRITANDTQGQEESLAGPLARYHVHLTPEQVGRVVRESRGVYLGVSLPGEGFGLPAVEAMACGIPAVLSDIPAHRSFDPKDDYARFVPVDSPLAMAQEVERLMTDTRLRRFLVKRGLEAAGKFTWSSVAIRLETILGSGLHP
ncbi:MAG: glycosyltransferase family 4 protein [Desulfobacterium sp.]|nr:glycosyltransferase family 4 protein [Desulfobacterium sp.]